MDYFDPHVGGSPLRQLQRQFQPMSLAHLYDDPAQLARPGECVSIPSYPGPGTMGVVVTTLTLACYVLTDRRYLSDRLGLLPMQQAGNVVGGRKEIDSDGSPRGFDTRGNPYQEQRVLTLSVL